MKVGIIGLESSGKKSLFRLLTGGDGEIGTVNVPDERVKALTEMHQSKKTVFSQIEFDLISSIKKDSEETKKALMEAREVDMFAMVIRQFTDPNVFHPLEAIDLKRDLNILREEMLLTDMLLIETRIKKIDKLLKARSEGILQREKELLLKMKAFLDEGKFLVNMDINLEEELIVRGFKLLTLMPVFIIINCDEDKLKDDFGLSDIFPSMNMSVKIESEIQQLDETERKEFLDSLGLEDSGLNRMIKFAYGFGDLIAFLTTAETETHSWTIKNGYTARKSAGTIHTDFEKGFIRAEVIHYDDLIKAGSESEAKKQGLYRLEGKEYIVKDGDVILFRFNV